MTPKSNTRPEPGAIKRALDLAPSIAARDATTADYEAYARAAAAARAELDRLLTALDLCYNKATTIRHNLQSNEPNISQAHADAQRIQHAARND